MKTVAVIGTFDSKGEEFSFLIDQIRCHGAAVLSIDIGTKGPAAFLPDITAEEVAAEAGKDLPELRRAGNAALCMQAEADGLALLMPRLVQEGRIDGAIAMGGGQGSSVLRVCLSALPVGMPKILVSTMAGMGAMMLGGIHDTFLVDPIVDFSGLNDILRPIIAQAGAAIAGMVQLDKEAPSHRPRVAVSMFGQTTSCVDACRKRLAERGYDVYPFHTNGMGGKTMESLIDAGFFDAVLDITTTELLQDMVCPGSGCLQRVEAAGRRGIPQIVVPGALDSTNILAAEQDKFPGRRFHRHNAEVLLMRARPEDERAVASVLAEKLNRAQGAVVVAVPMGGFSRLSEFLPDPEADRAFLQTLQNELRSDILCKISEESINTPGFAALLCDTLGQLLPVT